MLQEHVTSNLELVLSIVFLCCLSCECLSLGHVEPISIEHRNLEAVAHLLEKTKLEEDSDGLSSVARINGEGRGE